MKLGNYRDSFTLFEALPLGSQNVAVSPGSYPEDGWVTKLGVHAGGDGADIDARLILLGPAGTIQVQSATQVWSSILANRSYDLQANARKVFKGQSFKVGMWADATRARQISVLNESSILERHQRTTATFPAQPTDDVFSGFVDKGTALAAWVDFTENKIPKQGSWRSGPSGPTTNPYITVSGTLNHEDAENGLDYSVAYRIRIVKTDTNNRVWSNTYETTKAEQAQGYFDRTLPFLHADGVAYEIFYDHIDSFGVISPDSPHRQYNITSSPDRPAMTRPGPGRIDWIGGDSPYVSGIYNWIYQGEFVGKNASLLSAIQVEVWNRTRTRKLYDSGWRLKSSNAMRVVSTTGNVEVWQLDKFHPEFEWSREFSVRARARDVSGKESDWGPYLDFNTNFAPNEPRNRHPINGAATTDGIIAVTVSDDDHATLAWVKFRVLDSATGLPLPGHPVIRNGPFESGARVSYDVTPDMVKVGGVPVKPKQYTWSAYSSDGVQQSPETSPFEFLHANTPLVNFVLPQQTGIKNEVSNPSFEYESPNTDANRNWVLGTAGGQITYTFAQDAAAGGNWSLQAVRTATGTVGGYVRSNKRPYTSGMAVFIAAMLRTEGLNPGSPTTRLRAIFYDAAGTSLGTRTLTELNGGLGGVAPAPVWTRYGGYVTSANVPVGSTQYGIEIVPSDTTTGTIRIDNAFMCLLSGTGATDNGLAWLGYMDEGRTALAPTDDYKADQSSLPWSSPASGPAILTRPDPVVLVTYSHSSSTAKNGDRVTIYELDPLTGVSSPAYDSDWVRGTARTLIPIPPNILRNEKRYEMKIQVEDINGLVNTTDYVKFETDFVGPPPVNILSIGQDIPTGNITVSWEPYTAVDELDFICYELVVQGEDEGEIVVQRISRIGATSAIYENPKSGSFYNIGMRVVTNVGGGEVQSKTNSRMIDVDFAPFWFFKDPRRPGLIVPFAPLRDSAPRRSRNYEEEQDVPLHGSKPRVHRSQVSYQSGSFDVSLIPWDELPEDPYIYLARMRRLMQGDPDEGISGGFGLIVGHHPASKTFVHFTGFEYGPDEFEDPTFAVEWVEVEYDEDVKRRERKNSG